MALVTHGLGTSTGLVVTFGLGSPFVEIIAGIAQRVQSPELQWLVNSVRLSLLCKMGNLKLNLQIAEKDATILSLSSDLEACHTRLRILEENIRRIRSKRRRGLP